MITSVAMISVKPGHEAQVTDILNEHVNKEKKVKGCVKAYYKRALDTHDTFLVYAEYDNLENFKAADKAHEGKKEGEKVEFVLREHILKAFFGNFE